MKTYRKLFSLLLCLVLLVSCVGTVGAETGTNDGVSSKMNSDISSETNDDTSAENRTPVNYALGRKYTYNDDVMNNFKSGYEDDSCTLLTDGIVAVPETPFETVIFQGTSRIVTVILDLGATYNDIVSVNFCGVWDTYGDGTSGQNRGFSGEKTMFFFSENNIDYSRNTDFVMTKEETGEESYYNFKFNFNSPITASAVKIYMYSPVYLLSFSEIQVVGKPIMNDGNLGENVNYSLHDDGTMEIYGNGKMGTSFPLHYLEKNIKNVVIKGEVTLLPSTFEGMSQLESVELQGEIKELPANAFSGCAQLEKVILNNSLEKIGESAFFGCENLKSIIIPDSVESIGVDAFNNTNLERVKIPATVEYVGERAFGFRQINGEYLQNSDFVIEGFSNTSGYFYAGYYGFGFVDLTEKIEFTDDNISCDSGFVFGLKGNLKVDQLEKLIKNSDYRVKDSNGIAISGNSHVGTGTKITFTNGTIYKVVIKGDTDGNGSVTSTDYIQIKKAFSKSIKLVGAFALAADTTGDGEITTTDYIQVKSHFLGTIDIYA